MDDKELINVRELTDVLLLRFRSQLRAEMRRRGLADSVGSVGEQLVIEYFRRTPGLTILQAAPRGTKNVDALSRSGDRFSIKTICEGSKTGTIYPDPVDVHKQLFEFLLVVKLSEDWEMQSIHQFSWSAFVKVRSWDKRMNAWYISLSRKALTEAIEIWRLT
jgi:hypothetical protein